MQTKELNVTAIVGLIIIIVLGTLAYFSIKRAIHQNKTDEVVCVEEINVPVENKVSYWDTKEGQKESAEIERQFKESKAKWLRDNPPVKELFDESRKTDTSYVIEYLKENPIAGGCELRWIYDVVCVSSFQPTITFPSSRQPNY